MFKEIKVVLIMRSSFLFLLSFCIMSVMAQDKTTISGFVYDKSTGEVLIGASIYDVETNNGTISNNYGFYSLTIQDSKQIEVYISFIGYQTLKSTLRLPINGQTNFYLTPGLNLDEITVNADKQQSVVRKNETSVVNLQVKEIKSMPNLFGEVDIIKALQMTPGVQSGGEAKSNLYVRGGSPDQNLILLDDVPLYYVSHFGGFFSVFNADAINDVKLIKGGFPARFGSRLSSVLDIRMKEGNMKKFGFQGTVGIISSKLSVEGPIIKDKLSFIVSARKNLLPIFKLFDIGINYNFYDINAKVNYRFNDKNKLFLSFYKGDDITKAEQESSISENTSKISWGNTMTAFRWNHIYNNKLFSNLTISDTRYKYKDMFSYSVAIDTISKKSENYLVTGINDLALKMDYSYILNNNINFRFGFNGIYHTFIPNDEEISQSGTNIDKIHESYTSKLEATEGGIYFENELKYDKFGTNIGARYSVFQVNEKLYSSIEPRLIFNYIINESLSLKGSYSTMKQYVHLLAYSSTGIPSDYWMPTTDIIKPEGSIQYAFAFNKTFAHGIYELSIETYYKELDNLITFRPGESLSGKFDNWENAVERNGEGQNYGFEFFLQKKTGKTTGWIGATLSKAKRHFENIENGKNYDFKYDRPFDLNIVINHKLKDGITISATWNYGTGYPITLAHSQYNVEDKSIYEYGSKNSYRMRDYHRLDMAVNFSKTKKWGERTWSFSIFNVYNRQNPYYYYYDKKIESNILVNSEIRAVYENLKLYQRSLFCFFPSFSYSFKF